MLVSCARWIVGSLFLSTIMLHTAESSSILVFICEPAKSHHMVYRPIIRELAQRGHQVDYFTHFPMLNPPQNLTQIEIDNNKRAMEIFDDWGIVDLGQQSVFHFLSSIRQMKANSDESCAQLPQVQKLLASDKKYDMVIGEFLFMQETWTVLMHKFNAIGVAVHTLPDSTWLNELSGLPDNPAYMINFSSAYSDKMNIVERLWNYLTLSGLKILEYYYVTGPCQSFADQSLQYDGWEARPPLIDLARDLGLILTNSHHSLGYPYPKAPHVKEIMGTSLEKTLQPLPKDIQDYMDSAEHGVVYFSMGSMLSVKQLRFVGGYDALINVSKTLKQRVLWKWTSWSGEEMPDFPNIKMVKWLPQQAVLAHKNMKLFITHCGIGGVSEAINYGVPLVGLPVFSDQFRNAKVMSSAGFGVDLDLRNLTVNSVSWAINEVLDNPRYKAEALRRSSIFRDRPLKPIDEAVYWIEFVLKHGKVLQPASTRMPFYQLYLLDVMGILIVGTIVFFIVIRKIARLILSLLIGKTIHHTAEHSTTRTSVQSYKKDK